MDAIRTVIVEPVPLYRAGIEQALAGTEFTVLCAVPAIGALPATASAQGVQLALFDPGPRLDSHRTGVAALRSALPEARLAVLAATATPRHIEAATGAGVDAYLLKTAAPEVLTQSLRVVMLGQKVFPRPLADMILNGEFGAFRCRQEPNALSSLEREVLAHLGAGMTNRMIAQALSLDESAARLQVKRLLRKLGLRNRTQAAVWGRSNGLGGSAPGIGYRG